MATPLRFYVNATETTTRGLEYKAIEVDADSHRRAHSNDDGQADLEIRLDQLGGDEEVEEEGEELDESEAEELEETLQKEGSAYGSDEEERRLAEEYVEREEDLDTEDEEGEGDHEMEDAAGRSGAPPGLGAGKGEAHFDPDKPFDQLVCYFDTIENAVKNGLLDEGMAEIDEVAKTKSTKCVFQTLIGLLQT